MRGLKKYVESNKERLLKAAGVKWEGIVGAGKTKKEVLEARNKRKSHSQFMRKADEVRRQETWNWLKTGKLGKGTKEC